MLWSIVHFICEVTATDLVMKNGAGIAEPDGVGFVHPRWNFTL